jgi:hypothetical protein
MLWRDLFNRAAAAAETDDRLLTADRRFKINKAIGAERRLFIFIRRQLSVVSRQEIIPQD